MADAPARLADFTAKMIAAGAKVEGVETPAAVPSPAATPPKEEALTASAPSQPAGASTSAPAAEPGAQFTIDRSKLKRQMKWLDENTEVDLAEILEKTPEQIDEWYRKSRDRDRQEAKRRDAEESLQKAGPAATSARDKEWHEALRASGYRYDATTNRIVSLQPTAPSAGAGQPDLDALEKKATETNTAEDWLAYDKAIRSQIRSQPSDPAAIQRLVDERLAAERRKAEDEDAKRKSVATFNERIKTTFDSAKAEFDAAGPQANYYRDLAHKAALYHSGEPGATEESVLKVIRDMATEARKTVEAIQQRLASSAAPAPRAKAPTVVPSGGAPASTKTDPAQFDLKTKEGKAAAAKYLTQLRESQTGRPFAPSS